VSKSLSAEAGHVDAVCPAGLLETIVGKCGRIHYSHRVVVADFRCPWRIVRIDDASSADLS
jgi:hypothetical protein